MVAPELIRKLVVHTCIAIALIAGLLKPAISTAQPETQRCPAAPTPPTGEQVEALVKVAKDRGFLWKIEKDGRTAYLYGTIHVNKLEWMMPGPKISRAIGESEVFAFELDVLDPKIQAQMSDPSKFGIKNFSLSEPLKKRIDAIARKVCAPAAALAEMHPMMQFVLLALFDARFEGAEAGYGSEIIIGSLARGVGKSTVGLETPEQQMRVLFDGDPIEMTEMIESGLAAYEVGKCRVATKRLLNVWATGNLADLGQYEQWCDCAISKTELNFVKRVIDDRNSSLAMGIDKLVQVGKPVFAAVGALHMVGPKALPKLMAEMGYKVQRVSFEEKAKDVEEKKTLPK